MSILYAVLSQGPVVLARYASCAGNFQEVAEQILSGVDLSNCQQRMTYTHANYLTHYLINDGIIYLCITDESFDRYRGFLYLEDIKEQFKAMHQASPKDPAPYVWNDDFATVLSDRMKKHNTDPAVDQVSRLRSQVEDVQQTLVRNIEEIASRGERLELLVDKTNNLDTASVIFRSQAQTVARRTWWRNAKTWLILALVIGLSIYFLGAAICGLSWGKCMKQ